MALRPELRLRQTQRLALTPGLRQSLHVLQLPAASLADAVAAEVAENPFLEYREPHFQGAVIDHQIALDTLVEQESLPQYLSRQLGMMNAPDAEIELARYLAWNLTEEGFLADDPWTISEDLDLPQSMVRSAAQLLQSCEPVGIGAYGLKHGLGLQLRAMEIPEDLRSLILNNLKAFSTGSDTLLQRDLDLSPEQLATCRAALLDLSPRPAERFTTAPVAVRVPDILVSILPGAELQVETVEQAIPQVDLDQRLYQDTLAADGAGHENLQEQYRTAQSLIRAIVSRSRTILRIGQRLAVDQAGFFLEGPTHLRPMTQAEMASRLDIHPSTLSRAIAHKSLTCSHGDYPLSLFFTRAIPKGDSTISAFVVQREIDRMIRAEEPPGSLSDEKIATSLGESGVDIARRTVAKYRQCLNIPSSAIRRRSKTRL